jgi:DNA-directed RNA polymerase subunit M/transcription elongation factor TFIIS
MGKYLAKSCEKMASFKLKEVYKANLEEKQRKTEKVSMFFFTLTACQHSLMGCNCPVCMQTKTFFFVLQTVLGHVNLTTLHSVLISRFLCINVLRETCDCCDSCDTCDTAFVTLVTLVTLETRMTCVTCVTPVTRVTLHL